MTEFGNVDAVVGLHRGDEGKGSITDTLAPDYDIIARYGGGPNAGHTVVTPDGKILKLHGIPSGIGYPDKKNVIGDGVFVDANKLWGEIVGLTNENGIEVSPENLLISSSAHFILPHHIVQDMRREAGGQQQGSTKSGIAYVDADFALREGVRAELIKNNLISLKKAIVNGLKSMNGLSDPERDALGGFNIEEISEKYMYQAHRLSKFITDTALFLDDSIRSGKRVLAEGAQAFLLDKYQGMWPYVTSSITTSGGISPGLGVRPQYVDNVYGVFKAVPSHVGGGHFVTEINEPELLANLHGDKQAIDAEVGTTTGRERRLGHLDLPILRRANMVNGTTELALTKLDWVPRYGRTILICTEYSRKSRNDLKVSPNAEYKLKQSTPTYEELPNWEEDIQAVRNYDDLPLNARRYIEFIEDQLELPITMIGVGPRRDQLIDRRTV